MDNDTTKNKVLQEENFTKLKRESRDFGKIVVKIDKKRGEAMKMCASNPIFKNYFEINFMKLDRVYTCKCRLCPFCMTRKSILMRNNLSEVLKKGYLEHKFEYLHLTLALKNPEIKDLNKTIELMMESFKRLINLKEFRAKGKGALGIIKGWYRNLEITYNEDKKTFHPHFHIILAVDKEYFDRRSGIYITQPTWVKMWQSCLQVSYKPTANISKTYFMENGEKVKEIKTEEQFDNVVMECSKYVTKSMDLLKIENQKEQKAVVESLLGSLHKRRLSAYGGVLKTIKSQLKLDDEDNSDLVNLGSGTEIDLEQQKYIYEMYKWINENDGRFELFKTFEEGYEF